MPSGVTETKEDSRLIVIDGHNFLWRAFSVPFSFYSAKGTPLHVVTTYLKLMRRAIGSIPDFGENDSLLVVFDTDTKSDNHALSEDYKKNRRVFEEGEESPFDHLDYIRKALEYLKIPCLEMEGTEADDVIATVAQRFKAEKGGNVRIFSSDTDFYQLLDGQTVIARLKQGEGHELIDAAYLGFKLGILPEEYVFFKSLTGDGADNIRGVKGVGPKTAKKIIRKELEFDLEAHKDTLDLNRKLITLNRDLEFVLPGDFFRYQSGILSAGNGEIFYHCGF